MRTNAAVVVADGGRARFFRIQPPSRAVGGPRLIEREQLDNQEGQRTGNELFSNTKSGRNRAPGRGPAHGYDDHRARHQEEIERRFAAAVALRIDEIVAADSVGELILVAEPRMLGHLRRALPRSAQKKLTVRELVEDLSWHDARHIQASLVRHQILPPEQESALSFRPRGQPPAGER